MNSSKMIREYRIKFFATLKQQAGTDLARIHLPEGSCVRDLKSIISIEYPKLINSMDSIIVAINREYAIDDDVIPENAEIALFPPVSGGSTQDYPSYYKITDKDFDIDNLIAKIVIPSTGATCVFVGTVRGITKQGKDEIETSYLEYEAYHSMAVKKIEQVILEIRERWPIIQGIAIVQKIGRLEPGTPSVVIACGAAHRDNGVFEAARYGIDRIKEIVPIWKKEVNPSGEFWVEGNYLPGKDD
jgi:molybdopterin converting factor subunit 1